MKRFFPIFLLLASQWLFAGEEIDLYTSLLELDWERAEKLLDRNTHLLNKQGEEEFITSLGGHLVSSVGRTPLTFTIEYRLDQMAVHLIQYGAQLEALDREGWTPLMVASYLGNIKLTRLLLGKGAEVEVFDARGLSPLALAIGACRFDVADLLLEREADLYNNIPEVLPLVESLYKSKIHMRDSLRILDVGATGYPLFRGVMDENYAQVRTILLQGMNPDSPDSQGITPLMKSCSQNNPYVTELLIDHNADINADAGEGLTPLAIALYYGRERNTALLLEAGVEINSGEKLDDSPLYYGLIARESHLVALLVEAGCTVTRRDREGRTALMYAAFLGDWTMVRSLLEGGANPSALDNEELGVVYYAMKGYLMTRGDDYYTIIDRLIAEGASSSEYKSMAGGNHRFYELLEARWRD